VRAGWSGSPSRGPLCFRGSAGKAPSAGAVVFLDRDGTLNEATPDPDTGLPESPLHRSEIHLLPGAVAAARRLVDAGFALVCVTNQPSAAKGKTSLEGLLEAHERVLELLAREGVAIATTRLCPHHPEGVVAELSMPCVCRKPGPGMLLSAAGELDIDLSTSWMLGDTDSDITAGAAAGCATALIEYPPSAHKRSGTTPADVCAPDIGTAVARLLDRRRR
jgi:D-glycero-D-manno-heptose 1,7-bisphosphate phosphatase